MTRFARTGGRAAIAALLLSLILALASACGGAQQGSSGGSQEGQGASTREFTNGQQVEAVTPEEVLSEGERTGFDQPAGWNSDSGAEVEQIQTGTSAGAIPAVKPFNFGRNPGGPEDKTLYLTVPKLGLKDAPVYNSTTEEALKKSLIHIPATGFPWQEGANVYIAGHRIGYPGTGSDKIFYELDELAEGDKIIVEDSAGGRYVYQVTTNKVVGPDNVQVMNPVEGKSIVTLQTCTLPNYEKRIVVQAEMVEGDTVES